MLAPSRSPQPAVLAALESVTVVTGGRQVLGPLSWTLRRGEHWALLGPNGAGKTTLLELLGAERHPSRGSVLLLGERFGRADLRALRAKVGTVGHSVADRLPFGASALGIVLTGKEGLLAPWWGEHSEEDRATASALLERLGCAELAEQSFGSCSQGERQRILLARSLFGRRSLLLLDEPAVGLDLPGREALVAALEAIAADPEGPATVQVAHTLEELPRSISHALLLRAGGVVASGPATEVLAEGPLSACFGLRLAVVEAEGRRSARAAPSDEGPVRAGGRLVAGR